MTRSQKLLTLAGAGSVAALAAVGITVVHHASAARTATVDTSDVTASAAQPMTCANTLAQTEGDLVASAASVQTADCMFVGCGGFF